MPPGRRPGPNDKGYEPLGLFPLSPAWQKTLASAPAVWPAFDDTTAYIPLKTGALVALSLTDGATRWTLENTPVTLPPVVDSGRLYLVGDGTLDARDAATGQPVWRVPTRGSVSTLPVARSGWVILVLDGGVVQALKGETGEPVWQLELGSAVRTEPLISGDRVFFAPDGNSLLAVDLLTGKKAWERDLGSTVNSIGANAGVICAGTTGRMYFGVDEKRGDIKWKWRIGGDIIGRPAFDDEMAYVLAMDNTIRAFALRDGAQKWREALEYRPLSGPIRIEQQLLVASFSPTMRGYSLKDGKRTGGFNLPISDRSAPAAPPHFTKRPLFVDDQILMITLEGEVIALRRTTMGPLMPLTTVPGTVAPPLAPPTPSPSASATASLPH
jgi:outer membrane protein assembly factor BamB